MQSRAKHWEDDQVKISTVFSTDELDDWLLVESDKRPLEGIRLESVKKSSRLSSMSANKLGLWYCHLSSTLLQRFFFPTKVSGEYAKSVFLRTKRLAPLE